MTGRLECLTLLVVVAFLGTLLVFGLDRPFVEYHDTSPVLVANLAANYLKLGYGRSRLIMVAEAYPDHSFEINGRRPFLPAILLSAMYRIFGISVLTTRLAGTLIFLVALLSFACFIEREYEAKFVPLATASMAFFPINLWHSGTRMSYEVTGLACAMLYLAIYASWLARPTLFRFIALGAVAFIGSLSDWPFYYMTGLVLGHYWLLGRQRVKNGTRAVWLLPLVNVLGFGLFIGLVLSQGTIGGGDRSGLLGGFVQRTGGFSALALSVRAFLGGAYRHFTPVGCLLAVTWLVRTARKIRNPQEGMWAVVADERMIWSVGLLLFDVAHFALFWSVLPGHDMLLMYLSPGMAVVTAESLAIAYKWRRTLALGVGAALLAWCLVHTAWFHYDRDYPKPGYQDRNLAQIKLAKQIRSVLPPSSAVALATIRGAVLSICWTATSW